MPYLQNEDIFINFSHSDTSRFSDDKIPGFVALQHIILSIILDDSQSR